MVYEGRRPPARRKRSRGKSGGRGLRVCIWLLALVVAAGVLFPETMKKARDRISGALGVDISGAVRVFKEERREGEGILGAVKNSVVYAFRGDDDDKIPASDTPSEGDELPAASLSGDATDESDKTDEFAGMPLPRYVSQEDPKIALSLITPLAGEVTSPFGYRKDDSGQVSFHYGIDITPSGNADIRAAAAGTVMAVGESTAYGRYVILTHDDGVESIYAHLESASVAGGDSVEAGDIIGSVGQAEDGTAGALHLEMIVDGEYADPAALLGI